VLSKLKVLCWVRTAWESVKFELALRYLWSKSLFGVTKTNKPPSCITCATIRVVWGFSIRQIRDGDDDSDAIVCQPAVLLWSGLPGHRDVRVPEVESEFHATPALTRGRLVARGAQWKDNTASASTTSRQSSTLQMYSRP